MLRPTKRSSLLRTRVKLARKLRVASEPFQRIKKYSFLIVFSTLLALLSIWATFLETSADRSPASASFVPIDRHFSAGVSIAASPENQSEADADLISADGERDDLGDPDNKRASHTSYRAHLLYENVVPYHEIDITPHERMSLYSTGKPLVIESIDVSAIPTH